MVKWSPNKGRVIEQAIDATSTTKLLPLGTEITCWDTSSDAQGEGRFIYALGLASTLTGSLVSLDEAFVSTLGVANGNYRKIAVSMSANVATQYGWYQIAGKAIVKALTGFADEALCYLTSTAGSIDDAVVSGDLIYGMKGASAVGTPSSGLAYVQMNGMCFALDGDTLEDTTFTGTVSIGESGSAGVFYIFPATAASGKLIIAVTDQTGDTAVTLQIDAHGQATSVHLPDAGLSASYLLQSTAQITIAEADILDGATVSTAELNYLDLTGAVGIAEASKAMVLDANLHQDVVHTASLLLGATGATVAVGSTAAELNLLDLSAQSEAITAGAISVVKRYTTLDTTAGATLYTLAAPDATMIGQVKVIHFLTDNGDATLTLTNVQGGSAATTCTWANAGEDLVLVAGKTKWNVVSEGGVVLS